MTEDLDQVLRFVVALIACVIAGGVLVNLYAAWCDIRNYWICRTPGVLVGAEGQPLERALAGLDYFLTVKEERRFIVGARAEVARALAGGVGGTPE